MNTVQVHRLTLRMNYKVKALWITMIYQFEFTNSNTYIPHILVGGVGGALLIKGGSYVYVTAENKLLYPPLNFAMTP